MLKILNHPNVVKMLDFYLILEDEKEYIYFIMPFFELNLY